MTTRRKKDQDANPSVDEPAVTTAAVEGEEPSPAVPVAPPLEAAPPPVESVPPQAEPAPVAADPPAQPTDKPTPLKPDAAVLEVGQLADEQPDTMTLHTRDAFRMFVGRHWNTVDQYHFITGGRRFAAVLKSIWYLSGNDNPYADWILIRTYDALISLREQFSRATREREQGIEQLKRRGLALSVMVSRRPKTVELGFRSPYGYATADLLVEFDYFVRVVKTLVHKDRMSDADGQSAIRGLSRKMRALFLVPVRWERYLLREEMRPLSRADYLPGADAESKKRVTAAVGLFGEVPRNVFTGMEVPRHTKRRVKLTDAELRLLQEAPLTWTSEDEQGEAELI